MKAKIVLRRAWISCLSKPLGFVLSEERYETSDDARSNYHDHFLAMDIASEVIVEVEEHEKKRRDTLKGIDLPIAAYGGSDE